jgi:hypothetical protein
MQLLAAAMPSVGAAVEVVLREAIDTGRVAARVCEDRLHTRASPSRIAHESIQALVSLWGLRLSWLTRFVRSLPPEQGCATTPVEPVVFPGEPSPGGRSASRRGG